MVTRNPEIPALCLLYEWRRRSWTSDLRTGRGICHWIEYFQQEEQIIHKGDLLSRSWGICEVRQNSSSTKKGYIQQGKNRTQKKMLFWGSRKGTRCESLWSLQDQASCEFCISRNTASLDWKGQRVYKMRLLDPQNSTGKNQLTKLLRYNQVLPSTEKEGNQRRGRSPEGSQELRGWDQEQRRQSRTHLQRMFQALKLNQESMAFHEKAKWFRG